MEEQPQVFHERIFVARPRPLPERAISDDSHGIGISILRHFTERILVRDRGDEQVAVVDKPSPCSRFGIDLKLDFTLRLLGKSRPSLEEGSPDGTRPRFGVEVRP